MIRYRMDLIDDAPFKQKHRRIPSAINDEVRKHIEELLSRGVIPKLESTCFGLFFCLTSRATIFLVMLGWSHHFLGIY